MTPMLLVPLAIIVIYLLNSIKILAEYERGVAAVRAQLDAPAFAAAWADGRALRLEQAIAEALAP